MYRYDAEMLAFEKIRDQELPEADSVLIPQAHIDTILDALIAVYNATGLPARDTVVDLLDIHHFRIIDLDKVSPMLDPTYPWVQQLAMGQIPAGSAVVDSLIDKYDLVLFDYQPSYALSSWDRATFKSEQHYNVVALAAQFDSLPGVHYCIVSGRPGDGDRMEASMVEGHVELIYSHGWGDCPAGCGLRRYWKFNVYPDCSVEFVESYGSQMIFSTGVVEPVKSALLVAPNPFADHIELRGKSGTFEYVLATTAGQVVRQGQAQGSVIDDVGDLQAGLYLLTVWDGTIRQTFKVQRSR